MERQPRLQPPSFEAASPSQAAPPTSVATCGKRVHDRSRGAIFEIQDLKIATRVWKSQYRKSSGSAMVPLLAGEEEDEVEGDGE